MDLLRGLISANDNFGLKNNAKTSTKGKNKD